MYTDRVSKLGNWIWLILLLPCLLWSERIVEDKGTIPRLAPALAARKSQKLVLDNGLRVYLVSDPTFQQSAAALAVEAGSWDDPAEYPGMAHFLEHMLFMGTQAYPGENDFSQFISDNGGVHNAFTASDRTVYGFSVSHEAFEEAADRFAHFFIDPLLSRGCIDRELHAVDEEHAKNVEDDGWRTLMILKETGNPEHPAHNFSTGNAETLSRIPHEALREWMQAHYHAGRMHLVLLSSAPIRTLHDIACAQFSRIPNGCASTRPLPQWMSSPEQRGHLFYIKSIKDYKAIQLRWEFSTPYSNETTMHVGSLVANLLASQDEGCLAHWLKKEKLASGMFVHWSPYSSTNAYLTVSITLTEHGLQNKEKVVLALFQALARYKQEGIPRAFFDEVQRGDKLCYQFPWGRGTFGLAMNTADAMPDEDLSTFPEKLSVATTYDAALVQSFLTQLMPESAIYFLYADLAKMGVAPERREMWTGAEYAMRPIDPELLEHWQRASPHPNIGYPAPNPFLPHSVDLCPREHLPRQEHPLLLACDAQGMAYFAQDQLFCLPEIAMDFELTSSVPTDTPKAQALLALYIWAFYEHLSTTLNQARIAGMEASVDAHPGSKTLQGTIHGYSETCPRLAQAIFRAFTSCPITEEEFELYREEIIRYWRNAKQELPLAQAEEALSCLLFQRPSSQEKADALEKASYEEYQAFASALFEKTYLEATFYGNLGEREALTLYKGLRSSLNSGPFPKWAHPKQHMLRASASRDSREVHFSTPRQGSGVVLLLQEGPLTFERKGVQLILSNVLSESFFDALRTKQQTCYIAHAWGVDEERELLQFFAAQSSTHSPQDLLARFERFLEDFDAHLAEYIPPQRFEEVRSSYLDKFEKPPANMAHMVQSIHDLAFRYRDFQWGDRLMGRLAMLSYEQFLQTAHALLRSAHRRIAVLAEGPLAAQEAP